VISNYEVRGRPRFYFVQNFVGFFFFMGLIAFTEK
jgi:hypothetical protein